MLMYFKLDYTCKFLIPVMNHRITSLMQNNIQYEDVLPLYFYFSHVFL